MSNAIQVLTTYLFIPAGGWIFFMAIALFVVAAIFMATFNNTIEYIVTASEKPIPKISYLQSLSVIVLLYLVGVLLFKSVEPSQYLLTMTKSLQSTTERAMH